MKEKFDMQKARQICDHCCAPFSEVTDEHVSEAMGQFYLALDRIEELEKALIEERTWFLAAEDGHHLEDLSELVSFPGEKSRFEYSEEAREQLEKEGAL